MSVVDSLQANVMVQWISPTGVALISRTSTRNTSLPLRFTPLLATDAGRYTCRVIITSPFLDAQRSVERVLTLRPVTDPGM